MRNAARAGRWLAFGFLCLYTLTAQRGVSWQDSGEYQLRTIYRDIYGVNGLASAHPLYITFTSLFARTLERIIDMEAPCATTLASAFWMALALAMFLDCAIRLSRSRTAAFLATLTLGLSHLAWWLSTVAEVYSMSLFFLFWEMRCVVRTIQGERSSGMFVQTAAAAGFGFAVHNFALLSLPISAAALVWAYACDWRRHGRTVLGFAVFAAWGFAFLVIWSFAAFPMISRALHGIACGAAPATVLRDVLFGNYGPQVVGRAGVPLSLTLANFGIAALSISSPCWLVGLASLRRIVHDRSALCRRFRDAPPEIIYALVVLGVHAAFGLRYRVPDQVHFLLPTFALSALMLAPLLAYTPMLRQPDGRGRRAGVVALAAATVVCAVAIPLAANAILHAPPLARRVVASRARILHYRDEIRYWALPWKHDENSAERFAADAITKMNAIPGAFLYADSTSAPPIMLRYGFASSDWLLFTPWNDVSRFSAAAREGRPAFAVSPVRGYCPAAALATGAVRPLPL